MMTAKELDRNTIVIIICPKCEGSGFTILSELTDYHRREYSHKKEKCKVCDRSGRIVQETSTQHKPYKETIFDI